MKLIYSSTLVATLLLVQADAAALSPNVKAVCTMLHSQLPDKLVWDPLGPMGLQTLSGLSNYNTALLDYWNAKSAENRASCALFPSNANEVQVAVKALLKYPDVQFALKGGGHNPNLGFSSVNGGVLIAFRPNSQYTRLSNDLQTIDIGAGCKWEDVYGALQPFGKAVVGGRLGDVGAMGLTLGGGLSYLSAQYGFVCDNVLSFEAVLANGTIVNTSADSHADLHYALCGGGNQYAIVSKMTLKTYDIGVNGTIWGGVRTYTADKHKDLLAAVTNFVADNDDPKAAIIPTFEFIGAAGIPVPLALVFFFYDGLQPPAHVFRDFDAIATLSADTKARSFVDLTNQVLGGDMKGLRFNIRENTFPNMPAANMTAFLEDHYQQILTATSLANIADLLDLRLFSFAVQPMPRGIVAASKAARGGSVNALGMVPESGDRIWVEYDMAWASPLCDGYCSQRFETIVNGLHDLHSEKYAGIYPTNYESGDLKTISYNPIFMNDATHDQDVLGSYGAESYNKLKAVHEAYDPTGFFSLRQNGWKFK